MYRDNKGRTLFIDQGIGDTWATYYRKPNGSLKRFTGLKPKPTRAEALADLREYAEKKGLQSCKS